jgi:hypothetical protein
MPYKGFFCGLIAVVSEILDVLRGNIQESFDAKFHILNFFLFDPYRIFKNRIY